LQAPHLIMYLKDLLADSPSIQLSIDLGLQKKIEGIVSRYLSLLSGNRVKNAAVIVVENKTGAIRAYMGNADYSAKDDSGEVDVLRSFRQAGSTLKPFVYYLAFRDLGWNSETVILDEPIGFDSSLGTTFAPKNFDLDYRGEITVRQALAESRNIPAVSTLAKVGEKKFKDFLESLGVEFLLPQDDSGLSAVLGASEIRLIDLAKLYVLLARQGQNFFFCFVGVCPEQQGGQLLDRNLVLEITDILADKTARIEAFGEDSALSFNFPVAAKTGTSRNFRDNYTIGFTSEYTVLVWIGNADGSPMREVSGITGAGPIFQDTMLLLADNSNPKVFPEAERREGDSGNFSSLRILQPLQNAEFAIDSSRPLEDQKILFETNIEADFYVDGQQIGFGAKVFWIPKTGRHELLVKNGEGEQRVRFIVR